MTEENRLDPDTLLTYDGLSKRTGLSESTLRRRVKLGQIPFIKMGHQIVRFHYPTVLKHLSRNQTD